MPLIDLDDFYNDGTGWTCKHCERELKREFDEGAPSRLFTEGEAESKTPRLSNPARAKWLDPAQRTLLCPRCGITELADKA
jgi:hypothetical protein